MPAYQEESFLGSGDLQVGIYDLETGLVMGERDVGNATQFVINPPTLEKKELIGMRRANYAQTIKSVITKKEQEIKFTLTDINRKNLALAMFGTDSVTSVEAGTTDATPETVVAYPGTWVKLAHRDIVDTVGAVPVVSGGLVEDTDYEVDYETGRIYFFEDTDVEAGDEHTVAYGWNAYDVYKIEANAVNKFECFLRMIGLDQANDRNCEVIVHKAQIEASGDINWLTEDFAALEFNGKILATDDGTWEAKFYPTVVEEEA